MHIQGYIQRHLFAYVKQSFGMLSIIILIDLIPLFGILYWGWGTMDAVYLYFFETLILCFITYLKMRRSANLFILYRPKKREQNTEDRRGKFMQFASNTTKTSYRFIRTIISFIFLLINIPLGFLLMMIMLSIEGKGFSLSAIFGYDGGHTDLFVMDVNTFYIIGGLLLIEHFYTYYKKFVKGNEYESSGLLNEAIAFEFRILIQAIIMVGGVALIFLFDFSKVMIIILIILKTLIDVFVYLRNRYWSNFVEWVNKDKSKVNDELIIS